MVHADRLKVTFATGYFISRLAFSCLLQRETYAQLSYQGQSMLHWCEREVDWGTRWLLKTHIFSGSQRPDTWGPQDKFVVQVRLQSFVQGNLIVSTSWIFSCHTLAALA
jgi:hypothetical protein